MLSTRSRIGATLAGLVTGVALGGAAPAVAQPVATDSVLVWYDATAAAIAAGPAPAQVTNSRTWAIAWLAAARSQAGTHSPAGRRAALAGAVHQALTTLLPGQRTAADATLAAELAVLPDGPPVRDGVAAGRATAQRLLDERAGDGLDPASVNTAFPVPAPAPGVWQPTPPQYAPATQYGNRVARPFVLRSAGQFRPAAPPAVGSRRYEADLAEVRAYGSATSTVRTQEQTDTATFWLGSSLTLYTPILRAAVAQSTGSLQQRTALVALFHVASVDTQIATSDAKYAYRTWRPVTAIRAGGDADWLPLHTTPNHPDYPSGHNTYSGFAEGVLTALVGPRARQPYTIDSPSAPGVTRTYVDWRRPSVENVDARVWSGIHTRSADVAGIRLGQDVARYVVSRAHTVLAPLSTGGR